ENFDGFSTGDVSKILNDKYGEVWYQYEAAGDGDVSKRMSTTAGQVYVGFTNDSGNYVDVSQTANMYIYLPGSVMESSKGKTVKFEDYGDDNYGVTVKLDKVTPVSQDKDYIYAVAQVTVSSKDDNEAAVAGVQSTQYFFQKISKSQGDKKDGAYLPK
ncbi:hypothetical protein LWT44_22590, partial [Enterobacter hormaechei]|nr:hypothetical protein [Enterobacter hormaechei]